MAAAPAPEMTIFTSLDVLAGHFERVLQRGGGDDGRAVLVVVEDGDLHHRLEPLLDLEALRRGDVLEVDAAERRLHDPDGVDELLGVVRFELEIEDVDVGEALEEDGLPFHHRLAGRGADVAEAEDGGAVGDDGDEVAFVRVLVDVAGLARDLEARLGDAGRVGEREIALRRGGLGRDDFSFSGTSARVIFEGVIAVVVWHGAGVYQLSS